MKKHLLFSILSLILPLFLTAQERLLYVGTYTSRGSEGIYAYHFNSRTGVMTRTDVTGGIENPSFLASSPDGKYLYAVAENPDGEVNAYRSDAKSGKLCISEQAVIARIMALPPCCGQNREDMYCRKLQDRATFQYFRFRRMARWARVGKPFSMKAAAL
jgi:hypothetical protein